MKSYAKLQSRIILQQLTERLSSKEPGIPPVRLRHRVHGDLNIDTFKEVGKKCSNSILSILRTHGFSTESKGTSLDFGCGCGRVLTYLKEELSKMRFHGVDIDKKAIRWCKRNIPSATFSRNGATPPLFFSDSSFDLIYAISVFTHLDEDLQFEWLAELSRILKPRGILIASVHGNYHRSLSRKFAEMSDGFKYTVTETGFFRKTGLPSYYQDAQHTESYVRSRWNRHFEIVDYVEQGISNHHDAVVLRTR